MELWKHQDEALQAILTGGKKVQVEMACGVGKSFLAIEIARRFPKTLIVVPTLALMEQYVLRYRSLLGCKFLCFCSINHMEGAVKIKVKTNSKTLGKTVVEEERIVVMTTYASLGQFAYRARHMGFKMDVVILDEAHNVATEGRYGFLLDEPLVFEKAVLMTATRKLEGEYNMLDKDIYGECVYEYNFQRAIEEGIIRDYNLWLAVYRIPGETEFDCDAEPEEMFEVVCRAIRERGAGKVFVFNRFVSGALAGKATAVESFVEKADLFRKYLGDGVHVYGISGETPQEERREKLERFRNSPAGEVHVLCSSGVLSEGIDVPDCNMIIYADRKQSRRDIIQCLGRCIRKTEDGKFAEVVIPINVGDSMESEEKLLAELGKNIGQNRYRKMIDILVALKSVDGRLEDEEKRKEIGLIGDDKIGVIADRRIIGKNCYRGDCMGWWIRYEELKRFVEKKGRLPHYTPGGDERRLFSWIQCNRRKYKGKEGNPLDSSQKVHLENLDCWEWSRDYDVWWYRNYEKLKAFLATSGGVYPDRKAETKLERSLGHWVQNQRSNFQGTSKNSKRYRELTADKRIALEKLENWSWDKNEYWDERYEELKNFLVKYGRLPVGGCNDESESSIGKWCGYQRQLIRRKGYKYPDSKLSKLQDLPLWRNEIIYTEDDWQVDYSKLKIFVEETGRLPLTNSPRKEERKLAGWVSRQRVRREFLNTSQIAQMDLFVGFFWDRKESWEKKYSELKKYIDTNGKLPDSQDENHDTRTLRNWLSSQISYYRRNKLSAECREKIKIILPMIVGSNEKWQETHGKLCEFVGKNGRLPSILSKDNSEKTLGQWIFMQRQRWRKGTLDSESERILNDTRYWIWERNYEEEWMEKYEELLDFVRENGRLPRDPRDNSKEGKLARWCVVQRSRQREMGKHRKLTKNEEEKLELVPGWHWDLTNGIWDEKYEKLKEFIHKHGRYPSDHNGGNDEKKLGTWVLVQKRRMSGNDPSSRSITVDEKEKLESLPGWKWANDDSETIWNNNYNDLQSFIMENKATPDISKGGSEQLLASWCQRQRNFKRGTMKGNLSDEQKSKLEATYGWFWSRNDFPEKAKQIALLGHKPIYEENPNLYVWYNYISNAKCNNPAIKQAKEIIKGLTPKPPFEILSKLNNKPQTITYETVVSTRRKRALTTEEKEAIKEKENHRCKICHRIFEPHKLEIAHIVPHHAGGEDTTDNVIPLCRICHIDLDSQETPQGRMRLLREMIL